MRRIRPRKNVQKKKKRKSGRGGVPDWGVGGGEGEVSGHGLEKNLLVGKKTKEKKGAFMTRRKNKRNKSITSK